MTQTYIDSHGVEHPDRRQHSHLRAHFDGIRAIIAPFVQSEGGWGKGLSYLAMRQIQESYPALSAQEINILTSAVMRVLSEEVSA